MAGNHAKVHRPLTYAMHARFCKAFDYLINARELTITSFTEECLCNRQKYSKIYNEYKYNIEAPSAIVDLAAVVHICNKYKVDCNWLIRGVGSMMRK